MNYSVHLIYYDENIDYDSENYGYVKILREKIKGAFFPVNNIYSLIKLINLLKNSNVKSNFTLVTSGSAAEKVIPICSPIIKRIIIFCFYINKYLPLKGKFAKIKAIINNFDSIFDYLQNTNILNDKAIIGSKFITFEDYSNKYYQYHKKLAEFFNEKYYNLKYSDLYKFLFLDFINSSNIDEKDTITKYVNRIEEGTVKEFIKAYTGETYLCYTLNKWLRNLDNYEYDYIKYFAGPFSYALYRYAKYNINQGIFSSKTFYRKMTIKLSDYYLYKISIGELICYPGFTSTSEMDMTKYSFPTDIAKEVNNITFNDITVLLIIDYSCQNFLNVTPCICVSEYSENSDEAEYIFPPFSFFRINKITEKNGSPDDPHIIYMSTPNKKNLLEFDLKKGKTIKYNRLRNELYSS